MTKKKLTYENITQRDAVCVNCRAYRKDKSKCRRSELKIDKPHMTTCVGFMLPASHLMLAGSKQK
jgi:hypothetical protein